MNKQQQRVHIQSFRNAMTQAEVEEKSGCITDRILCAPFYQSAHTIMTYLSIRHEPDTFSLVRHAFADGKTVVIPVVDKTQPGLLHLSRLLSLDILTPGAFGILEPETIVPVSEAELDLIVVPGLVFDRFGGRIGYGKGYYDRLLERTDATKAAFCYSFQVVEKAQTEPHDIPMDFLVTESELIACEN